MACNFDVDALDINEYHDSQSLCHIKVPAGTTKVKRFDISAITYNSIRQFKINCNRYVGTGDDTDGLPTT